MKLLVTGGLGFIAKHFIRYVLDMGHSVINIDAETYAADKSVVFNGAYQFVLSDINYLHSLPEHDILINFAAESHVDRSIEDSSNFIHTNVNGVHHLLSLNPKRFVQISTDEVYGSVEAGSFDEHAKLNPCNPYSATKACADLIIQAHANTYGLNYNIVRPTNNYGCGQYPEKLIPLTLKLLREGKKATAHGDGSYVRMWLHVEDTVRGIWTVVEKGKPGEIYNIAGTEKSNLEIIQSLCRMADGTYEFVENRKGQDSRYSVSDWNLRDLGWTPIHAFNLEEIYEDRTPWGRASGQAVYRYVQETHYGT